MSGCPKCCKLVKKPAIVLNARLNLNFMPKIANFSVVLPPPSMVGVEPSENTLLLPERCTFFVPKQWESAAAVIVYEAGTGKVVALHEDRPGVLSFAVEVSVNYIARAKAALA